MADLESGQSKKRVAGRQISKENPELDDDGPEPEMGIFKKASNDVLATRRIVKVKRSQPTQPASSNPFASLRMVPPPDPTNDKTEAKIDSQMKNDANEKQENKDAEEEVEVKVEGDSEADKEIVNGENGKEESEEKAKKDNTENGKEHVGEAKPFPNVTSFQQLSSNQNAFMGLAGTGFGSTLFSFGSISTDKPLFSPTSHGNTPAMQEKHVETGEENEKTVFTADAILYEYTDGNWKERGKGELKLNVALSGDDDEKSRLVMRARGNYRLILNASLYPAMTLASMDKKGITFACINSAGEGKDGLTTFAIKFKDSSFVQEFKGAVEAHKGKKNAVPENSLRVSDD